ncbi:DUF4865 family protein [Xanthomonas sp. CFBP 8703]|uniref:DUF4865 family protein n=1 Tax=Xanthomonas bonasiae TaxID=2810351 RepID=A0ABS3B8V6_9XANT|nr:DUF4865 family protein [Xanthomonas bonasiae]MBN6104020.1 DUF4865 family protein [Xanthomonas bonasiae]
MIAMQYSIALPADYDMAIIQRRIADKGPLLDGLPGLVFKAYLSADRADRALSSHSNLYAPFYLWRDAEAMRDFLAGAAFRALTASFGRPAVQLWTVCAAHLHADLRGARYARREIVAIPDADALDTLGDHATERARDDLAAGALAAVSAYEPHGWNLLRLRLWRDLPPPAPDVGQAYAVGHVSMPASGG